MKQATEIADLVILSNGPGEISTWVRPVVAAWRSRPEAANARISVLLSPCPHATGREAAVAAAIPGVDRVLPAERFWAFLLWGQGDWDWRPQGVVLFLGGDQFFAVAIARRLGYRSVVYAEWDARWYRRIDRFAAMNSQVAAKVPAAYRAKIAVVGDLMAEAQATPERGTAALDPFVGPGEELVGLLPGSKAAKLQQGVPLTLAIAEAMHERRPQTRFFIPVAPTVALGELARWSDRAANPILDLVGGSSAVLVEPEAGLPYLKTDTGLQVLLWQQFPAWEILRRCHLCITTVGANTAELGSLAVPMLVLLPTQQLDAMRAWDGLPGLLANLPGVGSAFAKLINWLVLRQKRLFAWPNIWAGEEIVPELIGRLQPEAVADRALDWLEHPEQLAAVRSRLQSVRGEAGAAESIARIVAEELEALRSREKVGVSIAANDRLLRQGNARSPNTKDNVSDY